MEILRSFPINRSVCISPVSIDNAVNIIKKNYDQLKPIENCTNAIFFDHDRRIIAQVVADLMHNHVTFFANLDVEFINNYVKEKTNGLISKLLEYIAFDVSVIIVNTIYFKQPWMIPFNPEETIDGNFYPESYKDKSVKKSVRMMMLETDDFPTVPFKTGLVYYNDLEIQVLVVPFKNGDDYVIWMPNHGQLEKLQNLAIEDLITILHNKDVSNDEFHICIPKFKVETTVQDMLRLLKLDLLYEFYEDQASELTNGTHKCVFEISEEGVEAAAATALESSDGGGDCFIANRPFLFAVVTKADDVLFLGKFTGDVSCDNDEL
jgi:serpin B